MLKNNDIRHILKRNVKKRLKELSNDLDNVVFLDFDGVINLNLNNYSEPFSDINLIQNLNKFCLIHNFKIVVISSWRKYSDYKSILYESGLDKKIEIIGATDILDDDRESEIIKYLSEHCYINKFVIIDDRPLNKLRKYQIQTDYKDGFTEEKYFEAVNLLKQDLWF